MKLANGEVAIKRALARLWVGTFLIVGISVAADETMAITAGEASLYWDASLTSATIYSADSRFATEYHGAPSQRTNPDGSIDFSTAIPFTNSGFTHSRRFTAVRPFPRGSPGR